MSNQEIKDVNLSSQGINRRVFLNRAIKIGAGLGLSSSLNTADVPAQGPLGSPGEGIKFASKQLGGILNIRNLNWLKVKPEAVLALPYQRVRIPIPFDLVCPQKPGQFDWTLTDHLMDLATRGNKDIELQIGAKTIGWPEVNVPGWFLSEFKYLKPTGEPQNIDADPKAQEYILDYADRAAKRYLTTPKWGDFVSSLFIENEAFSKNLDVSRERYISPAFYNKEVDTVRSNDNEGRPLVQNIPFDTPDEIARVLKLTDIIGWNIYNQKGSNALDNALMWFGVTSISALARAMGRRVRVTEYQSAPWVNGEDQAIHPFSWEEFLRGLARLQSLNPSEGIYLWDTEYTLASNNRDRIAMLYSLAA